MPNAIPYILRILAIKPAERESRRLVGNDVPTIDVLITTCNEEMQVVMDTVRAACVLDYPIDQFRIFVCDDGASASLKEAVEEHAVQYSNLHYMARIKGPVKDYKAGNLNAGLAFSASLQPLSFPSWSPSQETLTGSMEDLSPEKVMKALTFSNNSSAIDLGAQQEIVSQYKLAPWGQYVAGLDADMIPEPHWLRALVPHIDNDPDCAMVCPPQVYLRLQKLPRKLKLALLLT